MLTAPGERVMLPEYGVGLRRFLFENAPEYVIVQRMNEQISRYLPEILVQQIEVTKKPRTSTLEAESLNNTLFVQLKYSLRGLNMNDVLKLIESTQGEGK